MHGTAKRPGPRPLGNKMRCCEGVRFAAQRKRRNEDGHTHTHTDTGMDMDSDSDSDARTHTHTRARTHVTEREKEWLRELGVGWSRLGELEPAGNPGAHFPPKNDNE